MHKLDHTIPLSQMVKVHRDLQWNKHIFKWIPSTFVFQRFLFDYLEKAKTQEVAKVLVLDLGIWPIISRPLVDYILAIQDISYVLKQVARSGASVVFQPMGALPQNPFQIRADISNHLVGALNYYVCEKLEKVASITCSPNWKLSLSWSNDLVCPGNSHTMCFNDEFLVTPPGRVTSDMTLKHVCSKVHTDT